MKNFYCKNNGLVVIDYSDKKLLNIYFNLLHSHRESLKVDIILQKIIFTYSTFKNINVYSVYVDNSNLDTTRTGISHNYCNNNDEC